MALKLSMFKKAGAQTKKGVKGSKGLREKQKVRGGPKARKIGIFGHTRSGKTVFLTMLWHQTHGRRDFSLETDDFQTRQDMSSYFDLLASGEWPPPTAVERLYRFTAVIDSTIRYPFESQDYQGESVSIASEAEASKKWLEYFQSCDCVFVLVDAEDLLLDDTDADSQRRKKIDSFELMLAQLVEGTQNRLKIPVAIVVTKADLLDGFRSEEQVVLVGDRIRYSRYRGYADFTEAVLKQEHVSKHLPWRQQVEHVLNLLRPVVDYCLTKSPDMQIFFLSSTGGAETTQAEDGGTITRPPRELNPIGLKEPFIWSVHLLMQKRRALIARKIKWWTVAASMIFIVIFSQINAWHDNRVQTIRELFQPGGGSPSERLAELENYRNHILTGLFKPEFRQNSDLVLKFVEASAYVDEMTEATSRLDDTKFMDARNLMRDLIDDTPRTTYEFSRYKRQLELCEKNWDQEYSDQVLESLYAQSKLEELEILIKDKLMLPESKNSWSTRLENRENLSNDERRLEDLNSIANAVRNLGGKSWESLKRLSELCSDYMENYQADSGSTGEWRTNYKTLENILSNINAALDNQDNQGELGGIISQLRGAPAVGEHRLGRKLGNYISGLRTEVVASSAGEELAGLKQEMAGLPLPDRYGDPFLNKLRTFVKQTPGTPESAHVQRLLDKTDQFRTRGVSFKVKVTEISKNYHLRIWDIERGRWSTAEVEPGSPGTLRWKPGDPIKFGIERNNPNNVDDVIIDVWEETGRWTLADIQEDGEHVFAHSLPVKINFPDLESVLPGL